MTGVKYIGNEICGKDCSMPFRSLETLCFENLREWEHWDPMRDNEDVKNFPRLRKLSIVKCPKLVGTLPNHLSVLEKLVISRCVQLVVLLPSLPLRSEIEIDGCKSIVCNSITDLMSLNRMTLSNISVSENWVRQRFQNLECMKIVNCEEFIYLRQNEICLEKPPQGLHRLTSLSKLCIENCPSLVTFPKASFLSILSELKIRNCDALTSLPMGMNYNNAHLKSLQIAHCHSLTFVVKGQLPSSLKILQIRNCEKLKYLSDDRQDMSTSSMSCCSLMQEENNNITAGTSLLQQLYIYNCPSLMCLSSKGQLPETLQQLEICDCPKLESLAEKFHNNTSLGIIWIWKCRNLKSIPGDLHSLIRLHEIYIWDCPSLLSFPDEGLPNTNLRVTIGRCEKLKALPNHIQSLNFLQEMKIYQCPSIVSFPDGGLPTNLTSLSVEDLHIYRPLTEWGLHKLACLRSLCIIGCPDALAFPQEEIGMTLPPSLTELVIARFLKLKYLSSKGFQNLTCLKYLQIRDCPKLSSFPETGLPSSLLELYVNDCPLLKKQCKRNKGLQWSMIAHIPCVKLDEKFIYDP